MSYNQEIYERAEKIIDNRKRSALNEFEKRKNEIYKKIPKIKNIESLMAKTSIDVAKEILKSHENLEEIIQGLMIKNKSLQEEKKSLLKQNGYLSNYLDINYYCYKCQDTGYTNKGTCECFKKIIREQYYRQLNIHTNISNYKFSNFYTTYYPNDYIVSEKTKKTPHDIAKENLIYCENYANNFSAKSNNVLMQGGTGLGKTHLSLAIAEQCINNNIGVIYSSAQQLLRRLEKEQFEKLENGFSDSILECDLLIIDDLGTEFYTQFTISAFYNIINTRLLEKNPTIINTNLSVEEILSKYSQRLASRIIGEYHILRFYGKDYRLIINN